MKIRTQFAVLVTGITLIPVLLAGVGWTFLTFAFQKNQDQIPVYQALPATADNLTDETSWEMMRKALKSRPPRSEAFVFNEAGRLIYGSVPGGIQKTGTPLTIDQAVAALREAVPSRDIFFIKPSGSRLWTVLYQDPDPRNSPDDFFLRILVFVGLSLLAMLLFAITLAIILGRALTHSIINLEKAARQVADGAMDHPITVTGTEEVRSLGLTLERMRMALRQENVRQVRFVMGISHDLKSPLTLIKGYVELLKDGPVTDPAARQSHFGLILDKVDQLDGMIDNLIDYSKTNTGEWQLTWVEVPLKAFLDDFASDQAPDAALLGRQFVSSVNLPETLTVLCDPQSIRRCLDNLTKNALRYTKTGDQIGITARAGTDFVEIVVWDNGPGIEPGDIPHLFELFFRGTHSRREPGMGMGLSIVKTILDSHGWSIRAESAGGARFSVRIPRETPYPTKAQASKTENPGTTRTPGL